MQMTGPSPPTPHLPVTLPPLRSVSQAWVGLEWVTGSGGAGKAELSPAQAQ